MVGLIGYVYVPFYKKMPSHFLKWLYSYTPRSSVRKFWMDTHTHTKSSTSPPPPSLPRLQWHPCGGKGNRGDWEHSFCCNSSLNGFFSNTCPDSSRVSPCRPVLLLLCSYHLFLSRLFLTSSSLHSWSFLTSLPSKAQLKCQLTKN